MDSWYGRYIISRSPYDSNKVYMVENDLVYFTEELYKITICKGFTTDGASVPRFLRWYISPFNGPWAPAACLHDLLYSTQLYSRKQSDDLFYRAMITSHIRKSMAFVIWLSVRLGGWIIWNNIKRNSKFELDFINIEYIGNK